MPSATYREMCSRCHTCGSGYRTGTRAQRRSRTSISSKIRMASLNIGTRSLNVSRTGEAPFGEGSTCSLFRRKRRSRVLRSDRGLSNLQCQIECMQSLGRISDSFVKDLWYEHTITISLNYYAPSSASCLTSV